RPAHHSPKPLPDQIPIDRRRPTMPPRVPSSGAFGRRHSAPDRSRPAGIRNPSRKATFLFGAPAGSTRPRADIGQPRASPSAGEFVPGFVRLAVYLAHEGILPGSI